MVRPTGLFKPINPARLRSDGTFTAALLFVDYPDAPASGPTADLLSRVADAPRLFDRLSYGRFGLQLAPSSDWLRMGSDSSSYSFRTYDSHRAHIEEAIELAGDADFSSADTVVVMSTLDATNIASSATLLPELGSALDLNGRHVTNATSSGTDLIRFGHAWLVHELLHSLGLPDLYAFDNPSGNYHDIHRFVGGFSVMGYIDGHSPDLFAYERWVLGWLDENQLVHHPDGTSTYRLDRLDAPGRTKAVIVDDGPHVTVIESRRPCAGNAANGVVVYTVDPNVETGCGPIVVLGGQDDPYRSTAAFRPGTEIRAGRSSVRVLAADTESDVIEISTA